MPSTTVLTESGYKKLLTDLRKILEEGRERTQRAAGRELVQTYWELGKRLTEENLTQNAGYGDSVMEDLAEDLDVDVDTLRKAVLFFGRFKIQGPGALNLNWAHYRVLLALPDSEERNFYEKEALRFGWTRDELRRAIGRDEFGKQGVHGKKARSKLKRPEDPSFVYKAFVERVVDGDTLILEIDLGFDVSKGQRIRLAGIDAPPLDTKKGYEAFEFVRDSLARVPFVMVKTHQIDIHGRYVAHVFYSSKEKDRDKIFWEGRYLNQELLDRGLARLA